MLTQYPVTRVFGTSKAFDRQVRTVCRACPVGCGLVVYLQEGRPVDVHGAPEHPLSQGRLCARGLAWLPVLEHPQRLRQVLSRPGPNQPPREEEWQGGMDRLAAQLRQLREEYGPEVLLIGCSSPSSLDFFLGAQRFAQLWGNCHVFSPWQALMASWLAHGNIPASSCRAWPASGCLLLVEADLAAEQPVAFWWLQEAQRQGAVVVAADARYSATLAKADQVFRLPPGHGNIFGLALLKLLLACRGQNDKESLPGGTDQEWHASYDHLAWEELEQALGLTQDQGERLARLLLKRGPVTVITGRDLAFQAHYRVWQTLVTAMGWEGQPGGGWYPLGAGLPPFHLHTYVGPAAKQGEGHHHPGADVAGQHPQPRAVICADEVFADYLLPQGLVDPRPDLLVHFGSFPSRTWQQAHFSFPASHWAEEAGLVFTNERAVSWGPKLAQPPAGCRSGLDFWIELAKRFGWEGHFPWKDAAGRADQQAFADWVLHQCPCTAHLSVAQLQDRPLDSLLVWPVEQDRHQCAEFAGTAPFAPYHAPATLTPAAAEAATAAYPLLLSRLPEAEAHRAGLGRQGAAPPVMVHPLTAAALGLATGDEVWLATPGGRACGLTVISQSVSLRTIATAIGISGMPSLIYRKDRSPAEAQEQLRRLSL